MLYDAKTNEHYVNGWIGVYSGVKREKIPYY